MCHALKIYACIRSVGVHSVFISVDSPVLIFYFSGRSSVVAQVPIYWSIMAGMYRFTLLVNTSHI